MIGCAKARFHFHNQCLMTLALIKPRFFVGLRPRYLPVFTITA